MAKKQRTAATEGERTAAIDANGPPAPGPAGDVLRPPAEILNADELRALAGVDSGPRPPGWRLSPRAVRAFICGSKTPEGRRKYFGDDAMVERAIISLSSNRGLMLVGEPGTAKSMLSELLAAAISGTSTNTIQGTALILAPPRGLTQPLMVAATLPMAPPSSSDRRPLLTLADDSAAQSTP
jgi:hypothetical protein